MKKTLSLFAAMFAMLLLMGCQTTSTTDSDVKTDDSAAMMEEKTEATTDATAPAMDDKKADDAAMGTEGAADAKVEVKTEGTMETK